MNVPEQRYVYRARCDNVVDGDTVDLTVDLGMHNDRHERVRLLGVNTPEKRKPTMAEGLLSQQYVERWIIEADFTAVKPKWPLIICTEKDPDAFGRYLAYIWRADGRCLNNDLLTEGLAVPYE